MRFLQILLSALFLLAMPAQARQSYRCNYAAMTNVNGNIYATPYTPGFTQILFDEDVSEDYDGTAEWSKTSGKLEWRWNPTEPDRAISSQTFILKAMVSGVNTHASALNLNWRKNGTTLYPLNGKITNTAGTYEIFYWKTVAVLAPGDYVQLYINSQFWTGSFTIIGFSVSMTQNSCTHVY